jgi:hypothetical protein
VIQPYGLLLVGFDYSSVPEDEVDDWFDTEHIPERLRIKGFINAQRWVGAESAKVWVATYDLERLAVLQTPDYRAIAGVNLSPWSKRITGRSRRLCRFEAEQINPRQRTEPAGARGLLMVAINVAPEAEAELNSWYDSEHMLRMSAVPGVLCARRFRMTGSTHRYLATYHLTSPDVQASPAWSDAAETPWAAKMRPHFRDSMRFLLRRYTRKS